MLLVSARQYAKMRGVSHTNVNGLVREGKIPLIDGKINPDVADAAWDSNRDTSRPSKMAGEQPRATDKDADWPQQETRIPTRGSFAFAQLQHENARAARATLEVQRMQGKVIDADYVRREVGNLVSSARTRLLAIGNKLAPQLAVESDPAICQKLLDEEVYETLTELSKWEPETA